MVSFSNENPDFEDNSNSEHLIACEKWDYSFVKSSTKEQVSVLISLYKQRLKFVYNLLCVFL